ncbi:hypothetical protein ACQ4PT_011881 [Festuca glaucescens]
MAKKKSPVGPSSVTSPEDAELPPESSHMSGFPEIKKKRQQNPYIAAKSTSLNPKFRTKWQEELYDQIYRSAKVFEHRYVDWSEIANPDVCAFDVSIKYKNLGLKRLATEKSTERENWNWNEEIVKQFYATLFVSPDQTRMDFMIGSRHCYATKEQFEKALSIEPKPDSDILHGPYELDDDDMESLYDVSKPNMGSVHGLKPEVALIRKINLHTFFPRLARGRCTTMLLRLTYAIFHERNFDIANFFFREMSEVIETPNHPLPYALHIFCLLRHMKLITKDMQLNCSLKIYSPQLPRPNFQPIALTEDEVREMGYPMIEQPGTYSHQPQQTVTLASVATNMVRLSNVMENLQKKVSAEFESMKAHISYLSSEVSEIKSHIKDPHHVLNYYKRKRA